jgi:outer membrane biogenesis lipoprotein LolB
MKRLMLLTVALLTACSSVTKQPSAQEIWKIQKACQFYQDVHPEEDMSKHNECNGFVLQNNKMPEN